MNLRISINCSRIEGPYGGVNQFTLNLEKLLSGRGHQVFRELVPNLDLILIVSSKFNIQTTSYTPADIENYLLIHPDTIVVQRINTCNESRGADLGLNQTILEVNELADYTLFVSEFIRGLYTEQGLQVKKPHGVIQTGAGSCFNPEGRAQWDGDSPLKVVTHHWSSNYMKGFDFYERLDFLLDKRPFREQFEFIFIGNLPPGFKFKNTKIIQPLAGELVARALKENHFYLTGARHEAGGNHYIEAMRCGLPVLYLESGSNGEYCSSYGGIGFTPVDFEEKLLEMRRRYAELRELVLKCPFTADWMAAQYEKLFIDLIARRRAESRRKTGPGKIMRYFGRKCLGKIRALKNRLCRG